MSGADFQSRILILKNYDFIVYVVAAKANFMDFPPLWILTIASAKYFSLIFFIYVSAMQLASIIENKQSILL